MSNDPYRSFLRFDDSIQRFIEHDEQIERLNRRFETDDLNNPLWWRSERRAAGHAPAKEPECS